MRFWWLLATYFGCYMLVSAQTAGEIAHWEKMLGKPATRFETLLKLADALIEVDFEKSAHYAEEASVWLRGHDATPREQATYDLLIGKVYRQKHLYKEAERAFLRAYYVFEPDEIGKEAIWLELGLLYSSWGFNQKADSMFRLGKAFFKSTKRQDLLALRDFYLGVHLLRQGEYIHAVPHFSSAQERYAALGQKLMEGRTYNGIGLAYKNAGFQRLALTYFLRALNTYEKLDVPYQGTIITMVNVGNLYVHHQDREHFQTAQRYYQKAKQLAQAQKNNPQVIQIFRSISHFHLLSQRYETALVYLDSALFLANTHKLKPDWAGLKYQKAHIYSRMGREQDAINELREALVVYEERGQVKDMMHGYLIMGEILMKFGDYSRAATYFRRTEMEARQGKFRLELALAYQRLASLYGKMQVCEQSKYYAVLLQGYTARYQLNVQRGTAFELLMAADSCKGDYKSALRWHQRLMSFSDSLQRTTRLKNMEELQILYDYDKTEKENQILKQKQITQTQELAYRNLYVAFLLILLLLVFMVSGGIGFFYYYQRQQSKRIAQQNVELTEANQFQAKLISIIAHDLRRPYANLIGTLQLIRSGDLDSEEQALVFDHIEKQTNDTNNFIQNLLFWAKSQANGLKFEPQAFSVAYLMSRVLAALETQRAEKDITIVCDIAPEIRLFADIEMLNIVVFNILSNAIKFSHRAGEVRIKTQTAGEQASLLIEDDGLGISPENMQKLQNRQLFNTAGTAGESGFGLGLMVCHDFIERNNGNLTFHSRQAEGSTFCISLPKA